MWVFFEVYGNLLLLLDAQPAGQVLGARLQGLWSLMTVNRHHQREAHAGLHPKDPVYVTH